MRHLDMRHLKPTTIILAFAFMSFASAKAITTASDLMHRAPAAEAELMAFARTNKPVIIEDRALPGALAGDHIETRKLILTAMSADADAPKIPALKASERPIVRMSKPYQFAENTQAAAVPAKSAPPSVVNKSATEQTFAVDSGQTEKVYTIAPGASVVLDECASGCTATGPWGYSRSIKPGETVETTGASLVTTKAKFADKAPKASAAKMGSAKAAMSAPSSAKKKAALSSKASKKKQKMAKAKPGKPSQKAAKAFNPYFKGSFTSLFTGIVR